MKTKKKLLMLILFTGILFSCENQKNLNNPPHSGKDKLISPPQQSEVKKDYKEEIMEVDASRPVRRKPVHNLLKHKVSEEKFCQEPVFHQPEVHNTNEYDYIQDNDYRSAVQHPLSTFSIDVDNASYSIVRQYLSGGNLPPKDAVRIEEMINYFDYDYKQPNGKHPFSVYTEIANAPWNEKHQLVMIGIKGKDLDYDNLKPSNLVFLIDTSGSMSYDNKLPLLKKAFKVLIDNLPKNSMVSIVAYAGSAGVVLSPTEVTEKNKIIKALNRLESGGSTAGGAGIRLAYKIALKNYISNGNNRVILATDGDFNVGVSSTSELVRTIKKEKENDIYLSILGFGMGNYKDGRMEQISNAGNGNYFYIDNYTEAKKVFQKDLLANMFTIAKDVKIQVEFNPKKVKGYRLIGYVNRKMAAEDFNDDKKDAGELGPGHKVTALYEIIPALSNEVLQQHDRLKYQTTKTIENSNELMTLKLRYKPIKSNKSKLIQIPIKARNNKWINASKDFRFAASVAGFGMLLRDSKYKENISVDLVKKLAYQTKSYVDSYKNEFITLIDKYEMLSKDVTTDNGIKRIE